MKRVPFDPSWQESIKISHHYDEAELWGSKSDLGYSYAYENRFKITIDLVTKAASPPAMILDLAAAQGNFTLHLAELGYRVVWNDLRAELADYVRQKYEFGHVEYMAGNIFDLPSELVGQFDVILATEIIEHVAHPDAFLQKLASLLKKDGTIVLTTPNGGYFRNRLPRFSQCPDPAVYEPVQFKPNSDGHIFLLHPEELTLLAGKAGLEVKELILCTNPLTNGHLKTQRFLRVLPKWIVDLNENLTRRLPLSVQHSLNLQIATSLKGKGNVT
jgi:2-polyprenyl-6-hydroxyphenyl methylase/3-demethylubiquinone-9 3-methyltransferase